MRGFHAENCWKRVPNGESEAVDRFARPSDPPNGDFASGAALPEKLAHCPASSAVWRWQPPVKKLENSAKTELSFGQILTLMPVMGI